MFTHDVMTATACVLHGTTPDCVGCEQRAPTGSFEWPKSGRALSAVGSALATAYPEIGVPHEKASFGRITGGGLDQRLRGDAKQFPLIEIVHDGAEVPLRDANIGSQTRVFLLVSGIALVRLCSRIASTQQHSSQFHVVHEPSDNVPLLERQRLQQQQHRSAEIKSLFYKEAADRHQTCATAVMLYL